MTRLLYNNVHTTLATEIDDNDTTIVLESALQEGGVDVPTLAAGDTFLLGIEDEIIEVDTYTAGATTITGVTRGYGDTLAASHDPGAEVAVVTAKDDIRTSSTLLHQWTQDNVAAAQTEVALTLNGGVRTEITMPRPGHIVGISIRSNAARSAGSLSVEPTLDGFVAGLAAVLDATDTQTATARQDPGIDTFTAGQRIGVKLSSDGSWAPTTADVDVAVEVILDD